MKNTIQITEDGLVEKVQQLEELKSKRTEIAERIATAREHGDLSENAEYSAARDEQKIVESKISELESIIDNAEVIEEHDNTKISIGKTVKIKRTSDKKEFEYKIVSSVESDSMNGKISDESPIGRALLGKKVNQKVIVKTPVCDVEYEIVSFE